MRVAHKLCIYAMRGLHEQPMRFQDASDVPLASDPWEL